MSNLTSRTIPNFVKAASPEMARKLYEREAIKRSSFLRTLSINFVNKEWYIWFMADITDEEILKEEI